MSQEEALYDARYRQGYRQRRTGYEVARAAALAHFIPRVAQVGHPTRVLDYGAGAGLHVDLWEQIFPRSQLYFTDISPVALERLVVRYPRYQNNTALIQAGQAPFTAGYFPLVVSVEVLEHVLDLDAYLKDIWRLLVPGGRFVWTTPCGNQGSIEDIYSRATGQIQVTSEGYRRWAWEDPTHVRRIRTDELTQRLRAIGFGTPTYRLRSHLFSFLGSRTPLRRLPRLAEPLMKLDYTVLRRLPNGASMLGVVEKIT